MSESSIYLYCGAYYNGGVKNGKPFGKGSVTTYMLLKGGEYFIGDLENGQPYGKGVVKYPNGSSCDGTFDRGYVLSGVIRDSSGLPISGWCIYNYIGGDVHEGYFVNGLRDGFGWETQADGYRFEGMFSNDKANGTFLHTDSEGYQFEVYYVDNSYISTKRAGAVEIASAASRRASAEYNKSLVYLLYNYVMSYREYLVDNSAKITLLLTEISTQDKQIASLYKSKSAITNNSSIVIQTDYNVQLLDDPGKDLIIKQLTQRLLNAEQQITYLRSSYKIKTGESKDKFVCVCGYLFESNLKLKEHYRICLTFIGSPITFGVKYVYYNRVNTYRDDELHECRCGKYFFDVAGLNDHYYNCSSVISAIKLLEKLIYLCPVEDCGMRFETTKQLDYHVQSHNYRE